VPLAQDAQRDTGVPASVTIAQAILESDWGTSLLTRVANNYFGIKANANLGTGDVYWSNTWEVVDGEDVMVQAAFQAYATAADSFADHGRFFLRNPRYAPALQVASDPRRFARAIAAAGYATDPAYAGKLIRLMDQYSLYQYDALGADPLKVPSSAVEPSSNSPEPMPSWAIPAPDGAFDCHCWVVPVERPVRWMGSEPGTLPAPGS
jgi:flagellum-specific peptidoglycan hydrolase FlgJ